MVLRTVDPVDEMKQHALGITVAVLVRVYEAVAAENSISAPVFTS